MTRTETKLTALLDTLTYENHRRLAPSAAPLSRVRVGRILTGNGMQYATWASGYGNGCILGKTSADAEATIRRYL